MISPRSFISALFSIAVLSTPRFTRASDEASPAPEPYFYKGYDYGSQALYSPLWVFLNRGYDVLQDRAGSRSIFQQEYQHNGETVGKNLLNPFPAIAHRGYGRFFREEIFPLSYTKTSARWVPNYTLHLIGGGMTYTALTEWFQQHDVPAPRVFSAGTLLASAFVNETLENKGVVGYNTDAIADFFFFDIGGIILFSFDWPNEFFSKTLIVADWSLQPSFTYPNFDLHNQGNYFSMKFPLPFYQRLRLFSYMGLGTLFGLSYQVDSQYSVSGGAGTMASRLVSTSLNNADNDVDFAKTAGLFVDRNNSLLASFQITNVQDYFLHFNLYPNVFATPQLGMWAVVDKTGHFMACVSFAKTFGVGAGVGTLNH
ncbi:MAG TPA: hypothetical protein VIK01_22045 [Polyangiaceae bacterium]